MDELTGLILTRQWRDTPKGIELELWATTVAGPIRILISGQQAVCFIERTTQTDLPSGVARRPLELTTLDGAAIDGLYFPQQQLLQRYRPDLIAQGTPLYESDIKPAERYLMERFITSALKIQGETRQRNQYLELINPKLTPAVFIPDLKIVSLDIETDAIEDILLSIACTNGDDKRLFLLRHPDWASQPQSSEIELTLHDSERDLLAAFYGWWQGYDPDVLIGWNVINFDLDFLERRSQKLRLKFDLGRGPNRATILQPNMAAQNRLARLPGRVVLDGIDTLRTATWSFEDFSLEAVAQELLGRGKLIHETEDRIEAIRQLYWNNPEQLIAYNVEDCQLVEAIFAKTNLINFALERARLTGHTLDRMGGSVAAFDNLYLPRLHRRGYVAPDIGMNRSDIASPGGYVMDSRPGLYHNVLVLDFKSLYPSIIRTYLIDPLGLYLADEQSVEGFLDASFSRDNPILPQLITDLWQARDAAKANKDAALSQAIKIIMNSFYGVLGSAGCRFHDARLASSITRRGHQIIQDSRDVIQAHGVEVIYGDTDSLFVLLDDGLPEADCLTQGHALAQALNDYWRTRLHDEMQIDSCLEVEFETHYHRFLMPTVRGSEQGSKKRYAGLVRKDDGFEIIFKGLEAVRTDWTPLARDFQRELYRRIFFNEPYIPFIRETVAALLNGESDKQLVYRKRLRRKLEDYIRNVPPHVQAARRSKKVGRWISYLITLQGPEPIDNLQNPPDYDHYIDRQLSPAANGILHFLETSFEQINDQQMSLL